eukprot:CAMPEP_0183292170 /NCGR_PEP_ID=MMETSP0160_2-20130417/1326_1 /TAXON_ID=2839 ORGANISM="Odontella Sinensis, Strain Grunow 1884" /NCGR_SAMPLE_ID=MMETSP0160_2 /ASSEMBLY_ACC=CAM_ASM_000250 /LENGTH=1110 /DNA_ID=CAMNT_0025453089 /DNA_START=101 /DNA_END=3433 /DNA_ORIENTATION=+
MPLGSYKALALSLLLLAASSPLPARADATTSDSVPSPSDGGDSSGSRPDDRSLQGNVRVPVDRTGGCGGGRSCVPQQGGGAGPEGSASIIVKLDRTSPSGSRLVTQAMNFRPGVKVTSVIERYGLVVVEVPEQAAEKAAEKAFINGLEGVERVEDDDVLSVIPGLPEEAGEQVKDGKGGYVVDESGRRAQKIEGKWLRRRLIQDTPWGIIKVQADQSEMGPSKQDIMICVIDTGYDVNHEDLPGDPPVTGYSPYLEDDVESNEFWNVDGHGHGTHCAGTIGAFNNDLGVVGVIPEMTTDGGFPLFIGKGLTNSGSGSSSGVMRAVEACHNEANRLGRKAVISMSLGGGGYSGTYDDTYKYIYNTGNVLIVAAAGNDGNSAKGYPASYTGVMSVAATDSSDRKASFSQYNDQVEISGPGVGVKSTTPDNGYSTWSGTSMATPHVAGVAALVWSHNSNCTSAQIRAILSATAMYMSGQNSCDEQFGYGMVQAKAAIQLLQQGGCDAGSPNFLLTEDGFTGCKVGPTSAPTQPPTISCDVETSTLTLTLKTDSYGGDTGWELKDANDIVKYSASADSYGNLETYIHELDVCAHQCEQYTFTITDTWGDGICCQYGNGSYEIKNGEKLLAGGGEFSSEEIKQFTVVECSNDPDPTQEPTWTPTVSPLTSAPTGASYYLACGSPTGDCQGEVATAAPSETHEVRCCSDTEKTGWIKKDSCDVWGESDLPTCVDDANYAEAVQICADNDARLCTVAELLEGCTKGSGCMHDHDLIWSSDIEVPTLSPTPIPTTAPTSTGPPTQIGAVGETGRVSIDSHGKFVHFRYTYLDPVVVAFVNTRNGNDAVDVRVKDVTSRMCSIFLEEPPAFDGPHPYAESVSYIVMESGRHVLEGGVIVEAGRHFTDKVHRGGAGFDVGDQIAFDVPFSSTPAVLATLNTYNNGKFMTSLTTNVMTSSFEIAQEALETDSTVAGEEIGWMAFEPNADAELNFIAGYAAADGSFDGVGQSGLTIDISGAGFMELPDLVVNVYGENGVDGSYARGAGVFTNTTQTVYAEEDTKKDPEQNHNSEPFAWVGFSHESNLFEEGAAANACKMHGEECNRGFDCCSNECLGDGMCL